MRKKLIQTDDVRERLLICGIELFQKHGFHATGIKNLVAGAQIPKGSFYYYFSSKEEFVAEVIARYIQPYVDQVKTLSAVRDKAAFDLLREYFLGQIEEFEENPGAGGCLLGNLLGEIGDTSEAAVKSLSLAVNQYKSVLAELLQRAQQEGDVRSDFSSDALAGIVFDTWQGAILRMRVEGTTGPLLAFVAQTLNVIISLRHKNN